jgi:hypothetical protein
MGLGHHTQQVLCGGLCHWEHDHARWVCPHGHVISAERAVAMLAS